MHGMSPSGKKGGLLQQRRCFLERREPRCRLLGARGGNKEQAGGLSSRDDDHVGFHFIFLYCHVEDSNLVTINLYFYADITLFS